MSTSEKVILSVVLVSIVVVLIYAIWRPKPHSSIALTTPIFFNCEIYDGGTGYYIPKTTPPVFYRCIIHHFEKDQKLP